MGNIIGPWGFLTPLSAFEFITGLALLVGLLVRPIALIYLFLLWSFVFSLPVHTVPETTIEAVTFEGPAILIQVRDIALAGLTGALFLVGSGRFGLDQRLVWPSCQQQ